MFANISGGIKQGLFMDKIVNHYFILVSIGLQLHAFGISGIEY